METTAEPGAYAAGYGLQSLRPVALGFVIPVVFFAVGVWYWDEFWIFAVIGLVGMAAVATAIALRLRRVVRREVVLLIDSRGVWWGGDGISPPARVPWPKVDAVVYFNVRLRPNQSDYLVPCIGIVRGKKIADARKVSSWRIDHAQAQAAIARFGDVSFREAPTQTSVPRLGHPGAALPDDWFTSSS